MTLCTIKYANIFCFFLLLMNFSGDSQHMLFNVGTKLQMETF